MITWNDILSMIFRIAYRKFIQICYHQAIREKKPCMKNELHKQCLRLRLLLQPENRCDWTVKLCPKCSSSIPQIQDCAFVRLSMNFIWTESRGEKRCYCRNSPWVIHWTKGQFPLSTTITTKKSMTVIDKHTIVIFAYNNVCMSRSVSNWFFVVVVSTKNNEKKIVNTVRDTHTHTCILYRLMRTIYNMRCSSLNNFIQIGACHFI